MGAISEIIKKLQEAKNLEIEEDENKRIRITIKNGKVDVAVEAVPDCKFQPLSTTCTGKQLHCHGDSAPLSRA